MVVDFFTFFGPSSNLMLEILWKYHSLYKKWTIIFQIAFFHLFICLYIYSKIWIFPLSWVVRLSALGKHTSHRAMSMKFSHEKHYVLVNIVCKIQLSTLYRKEMRVPFVRENEFGLQVQLRPPYRARQTSSHFCFLVTIKRTGDPQLVHNYDCSVRNSASIDIWNFIT